MKPSEWSSPRVPRRTSPSIRSIAAIRAGEIEPGCWLALRWGMGKDCVLVLKLDEFEQPVNFQNIIKRAK
jgi:hypothetical protein